MVYQLAPLATLVATLVTLAILAKNNEVIAFKASGISLYRLILPLTLAGCLIAGGMFLLDDTILPYANQRQDALRNQIKGRPAQTYFQPARQWILGEDNKIYNYELFDPDQQAIWRLERVSNSIPPRFRFAGASLPHAPPGSQAKTPGRCRRLDSRFQRRADHALRSV